jgi:glycine oxidase
MAPSRDLSGRSFAVVGAGIVGLSLARALRRRGGKVVVLEARRAGAGASGAAAGVLPEPGRGQSLLDRLTRGAQAGYERWLAEIEGESGLKIEFRRAGFIQLALDRAEEAKLQKRLQGLSGGGAQARWIDPPALRALAPGVTGKARGGLYLPRAAWVNPPALLAALRAGVERLGVSVREGERAEVRRGAGTAWELFLPREGEVIAGKEVLVAAGAWSGELLARSGVGLPAALRPIRGQMVEVELHSPLFPILGHGDVYLIPRAGGSAWVGATVEDVGFDERVSEEGVRWLVDEGRLILPDLGPVRRSWAGLRPKLLRRGGPLLGEGDPAVLAGHYRSGIHLGPLTAHLLAARLAGEAVPDVSPFEFEPPLSARSGGGPGGEPSRTPPG